MSARKLLLVVLFLASSANADDVEGNRAGAKSLRDLGAKAFDAGNYKEALEHFQDAYRLYPSPNLHYNLGYTLQKLGRDVEAIREFEAFVLEAKNAPIDKIAEAKKFIAEVDKRVARLIIASNVKGADVSVDENPIGVTPLERSVRVEPGAHDLLVKKIGYLTFGTKVVATAGDTKRIFAEMQAVEAVPNAPSNAPWSAPQSAGSSAPPAPATSGPLPSSDRQPPSRILPLLVGGFALASIVVGVGLYGSIAADPCWGSNSCAPGQYEHRAQAGDVLVGIGVAAAVVDVVLWVIDARRRSALADRKASLQPPAGRSSAVISF